MHIDLPFIFQVKLRMEFSHKWYAMEESNNNVANGTFCRFLNFVHVKDIFFSFCTATAVLAEKHRAVLAGQVCCL